MCIKMYELGSSWTLVTRACAEESDVSKKNKKTLLLFFFFIVQREVETSPMFVLSMINKL